MGVLRLMGARHIAVGVKSTGPGPNRGKEAYKEKVAMLSLDEKDKDVRFRQGPYIEVAN